MTTHRRRFLRLCGVAGISAIAGCSDSSTDDEMSTSDQSLNTTQEQSTPTQTAEPGPEVPEPRFIVAADGSGDYELLQEAYDVAQDGDVIQVKDGKYDVTLNTGDLDLNKSVDFVGSSREASTITVEGDGSDNEISIGGNAFDVWNLTIEPANSNDFLYVDDEYQVNYSNYNISTRGWANFDRASGKVSAYQSIFDAQPIDINSTSNTTTDLAETPLTIGALEATDCTFNIPINITGPGTSNVMIEESTFHDYLEINRDTGGRISNSTLQGLRVENTQAVRVTVSESELLPDANGNSMTFFETGAASTATYAGPQFRFCTFRGMIDGYGGDEASTGSYDGPVDRVASRIEGCTFDGSSLDGDYIIDGYGANHFTGNVFLETDIRIDNSDVSMYDEQAALGNYYSSFDVTDDNGDNISDLPRSIPGDGEVTDQYPLVEPDPSDYSIPEETEPEHW